MHKRGGGKKFQTSFVNVAPNWRRAARERFLDWLDPTISRRLRDNGDPVPELMLICESDEEAWGRSWTLGRGRGRGARRWVQRSNNKHGPK